MSKFQQVSQAQAQCILAMAHMDEARELCKEAFAGHQHTARLNELSAEHEKLFDDADTIAEMDAREPAGKIILAQMRPLDDERVADLRSFIDTENECRKTLRACEDTLLRTNLAYLQATQIVSGFVIKMYDEVLAGQHVAYRAKLVDLALRLREG